MNDETHQTAWRAWSATERDRLQALPKADLLVAVQAGALDNLTEEDAKAILTSLAGFRAALPVVRFDGHVVKTVRPTGRRPDPLGGRGLPIGPKVTVTMQLKKNAGILVILGAALLWTAVFAFGHQWLIQHSYIG